MPVPFVGRMAAVIIIKYYKVKYQLWITFFNCSNFGLFLNIFNFFQLVRVEWSSDNNILENGVSHFNSLCTRAVSANVHLIRNRARGPVADNSRQDKMNNIASISRSKPTLLACQRVYSPYRSTATAL